MQRLDEIVHELLAGVRARIDAEADNATVRGQRFERIATELEELAARKKPNRRKRRDKTGAGVEARPGKVAPGKDTGRDVGRGSAVASHRRREDRDARLPGGELV